MMSDAANVKGRLAPNPTLNDAFLVPQSGVQLDTGLPGEILACGGILDQMASTIPSQFQVSVTLIRASLTIVHAHLATSSYLAG